MSKKKDREKAKEMIISMASKKVAAILDNYAEWSSITGGSAQGEIDVLAGPDGLEAPISDENILRMKPILLRWQAIDHWMAVSEPLLEWAFLAELDHQNLMAEYEKSISTFVSPVNEERHRLYVKLRNAASQRKKPYTILVLPTDLVEKAADGLMKLDYGEVIPMFERAGRKSFKDGYTIPSLRDELLTCTHYLYGRGFSMAKAQERIAKAAAVTTDAVRNWHRAEQKRYGPGMPFEWVEAEIRGAFDVDMEMKRAGERLHVKLDSEELAERWGRLSKDTPWFAGLDDIERAGKEYQLAVKAQAESVARQKQRPRKGKSW